MASTHSLTPDCLVDSRRELLAQLASTYGTPLYVYDMPKIARNFTAFKQAFSGRKSLICYALKANSNLSILRLLAELGSGADCVSIGEVRRALLAGIPAYKIIFSGVGKRDDEIRQALELGILFINVESFEELRRVETITRDLAQKLESRKALVQKARISIRVNPNIDPKTHPYISTGLYENKFGVDMDSAKQMYLYAHKSAFLEPIGIHFHIGSQLIDLDPLTQAARKIADLARALLALGINLRFFDIGGGLGICYEDEKPIDLYDYAQGILATLSGCDLTIICEPGRRIVGDSGLLLTRVISQKLTESKRFVIVDAGMNDLMRPALYGAYHQPIVLGYDGDLALGSHSGDFVDSGVFSKNTQSVANSQETGFAMRNQGFEGGSEGIYLGDNEQAPTAESTIYRAKPTRKPSKAESTSEQPISKADIVGPVCESSDTFCKNIPLPPLHNGALLGFENAGAYGYSMASTYNARMRPAEVGIYADGARLIKPRESFEASVADELALLDSSK
ncbi:diaminopimelate decarboxylase [Helicobacter sp.]|uniref:diaminopimelate decarboxylase n=1 Tax=Helicobacter sp. TaxID=218 RepID=UPI0025C30B86|nr:diaminopimelate decarboxylase [Helicobacter sp.]MBR2493984.1 diaminopimelate decarboxylase [Helicobacter sp.]